MQTLHVLRSLHLQTRTAGPETNQLQQQDAPRATTHHLPEPRSVYEVLPGGDVVVPEHHPPDGKVDTSCQGGGGSQDRHCAWWTKAGRRPV